MAVHSALSFTTLSFFLSFPFSTFSTFTSYFIRRKSTLGKAKMRRLELSFLLSLRLLGTDPYMEIVLQSSSSSSTGRIF